MKRRPDKGKTGPDPISLTGEVLDNLNRGMISLDSNMNLTYANRTASRFLGKRHATLVGQALPSVISGPICHTFSEAFLRALRETIVVSSVPWVPTPPLMRLPSVTSFRPIRPEIGAVTRV